MITNPITVSLPDTADATEYDVQLQRTLVRLFAAVNQALAALAIGESPSSTGVPVSGIHSPGEFVWNSATTELGLAGSKYILLGWSCVLGGSPGTWKECRCLTGN